eukprot:COSAG02_NODE_30092_length_557_cov_1.089520_1_plen_73_part_00
MYCEHAAHQSNAIGIHEARIAHDEKVHKKSCSSGRPTHTARLIGLSIESLSVHIFTFQSQLHRLGRSFLISQ